MKRLLIVCALLFASSVYALEDTPENRAAQTQRYLHAMSPRELMTDMADQLAKTVPPDQRDLLRNVLTKYLDLDALTKAMTDSMVKHFSADELKALADFYGSPVGKSAMKKFGAYMADLSPTIQAEMTKAMAKANQEIPDNPKP